MDTERHRSRAKWQSIVWYVAVQYLLAVLFFAWGMLSYRYRFFPAPQLKRIKDAIQGGEGDDRTVIERLTGHPQVYARKKAVIQTYQGNCFALLDKSFADPGYLLVSRYDDGCDQDVFELVELDGFHVLHRWLPPVEETLAEYAAREKKSAAVRGDVIYMHPALLPGGRIVCNVQVRGFRYVLCLDRNSKTLWVNPTEAHHSVEVDHNGNIVVCSHLPVRKEIWGEDEYVNDGYTVISPSGETLEQRSVVDIMRRHGACQTMLVLALNSKPDFLHLNDVQPIRRNRGSARVGDLAISMRMISTVMLYRPKTDEIIWQKTEPWFAQHDVDQLNDGTFAVFNNNDLSRMYRHLRSHRDVGLMDIIVFDPETGEVTSPYASVLKELGYHVKTQGLCRILANGDAFFEVPQDGVLYRVSENSVRWRYENILQDKETVGILTWSRYYPRGQIDLAWLDDTAKGSSSP